MAEEKNPRETLTAPVRELKEQDRPREEEKTRAQVRPEPAGLGKGPLGNKPPGNRG